ncbi:hypothetical protein BD413DRAFT_16482 [Trametes elegans]|nr:hypothetical protein BD413DRAFT_16482 [Trametes elegans]
MPGQSFAFPLWRLSAALRHTTSSRRSPSIGSVTPASSRSSGRRPAFSGQHLWRVWALCGSGTHRQVLVHKVAPRRSQGTVSCAQRGRTIDSHDSRYCHEWPHAVQDTSQEDVGLHENTSRVVLSSPDRCYERTPALTDG